MGYQTGGLQKIGQKCQKIVKIGCKLVKKTKKFQLSSSNCFEFFRG
jgi:hypothetical protein